MRRLPLLLLLAAVVAGCGGSAKNAAETLSPGSGPELRGTPLEQRAPQFRLRDAGGRAVSLGSLRGNWVLVTFLYTHCPDVCPLIATNLGVVLRQLPAGQRNVRAVAISVDPKGDTPAAVRRFVRIHRLPPAFLYLIGSRAELTRTWHAYGIGAEAGPEQTVSHSAYTLLVDPRGNERALYEAQVRPRDVLHDLAALRSG